MIFNTFDAIDKDSKMFLFKELMKRFDLFKVYYYQHTSEKWEGYQSIDIKDIYNTCEELFKFFIKNNDSKEETPASTAGFNIFMKKDYLYINYENRLGYNSIGYTESDALVTASLDYMSYLRSIKINKIKNDTRRSETVC